MAKGARKILKGDIALSLSPEWQALRNPKLKSAVGTLAVGWDFASKESGSEVFHMQGG